MSEKQLNHRHENWRLNTRICRESFYLFLWLPLFSLLSSLFKLVMNSLSFHLQHRILVCPSFFPWLNISISQRDLWHQMYLLSCLSVDFLWLSSQKCEDNFIENSCLAHHDPDIPITHWHLPLVCFSDIYSAFNLFILFMSNSESYLCLSISV